MLRALVACFGPLNPCCCLNGLHLHVKCQKIEFPRNCDYIHFIFSVNLYRTRPDNHLNYTLRDASLLDFLKPAH